MNDKFGNRILVWSGGTEAVNSVCTAKQQLLVRVGEHERKHVVSLGVCTTKQSEREHVVVQHEILKQIGIRIANVDFW